MSTPTPEILEVVSDSVAESQQTSEHPFREMARFVIIALIIVVPIRIFIAQPFIVSGASMFNTFEDGQYLIVDQVSYYTQEPARGEVIIFRYPKDPSKYFIKRLIGIPGDTIAINGREITITNKEHPGGFILEEPYVDSMSEANTHIETLGEDEYFVMGDNRDYSSDSRSWGILTKDKIIGRALLRLFPVQHFGLWPGEHTYENTNEPKQ